MSVNLTNSLQPVPGLEANLGYLFRLAHQRLRAALDDGLQDLGLSAQEYVILSLFETRPELSTSELARITQVTRQTMHTAVLGLETAGLLERRSTKQRAVLVRPTKRGRKTLRAATELVRAIERTALAGLSRNDERAVRTRLANLAAMTTSTRQTNVDCPERVAMHTKSWVLMLAAAASLMVSLYALVVTTALPTIRHELDASLRSLEWTTNAYTLSFAVLPMSAAALGDCYGRRRMFAFGVALFGAASVGCALAPSAGLSVAARAVHTAGAAFVMPLALALLTGAFAPRERPRAPCGRGGGGIGGGPSTSIMQ
jgi:DNA-binding MarR family transcriptional regulator